MSKSTRLFVAILGAGLATYALAQSHGSGTMGGPSHDAHRQSGQMMSGSMMKGDMMKGMVGTMSQMNQMMQKMAGMMEKHTGMDMKAMGDMSRMMEDMAAMMKDMAGHMKQGQMTGDMSKQMRERMAGLGKKMDALDTEMGKKK